MPKQLITVGPSPFRTPERMASSSNTGTMLVAHNAEADEFVFVEGSSTHAHPYSHTSNWDERLTTDLSVSGTYSASYATARTHDLTLTGYTVISLTGAISDFATDMRFLLRQDGTGSRTVAWPSTITWVGDSIPTLQTAANAVDTIGLLSVDGGTSWFGYHAEDVVQDHGALTGLSDNDHPQYSLTTHTHSHTHDYAGELLVNDDITSPPESLWSEDGTDWLYEDV